jgi:hypothetical protein
VAYESSWIRHFQTAELIHTYQYQRQSLGVHCDLHCGKQVEYNDSKGISTGDFYLKNILKYLKDLDKEGKYTGAYNWDLVASRESVPQQENGFDCS